MRISDVDDGLSLEGETMWLLRSSALVFASGCGYFAALVLSLALLRLVTRAHGAMVAVASVCGPIYLYQFESLILIPKLLFLNSYSYILCTQTLGIRKPVSKMMDRGKIFGLAAKRGKLCG